MNGYVLIEAAMTQDLGEQPDECKMTYNEYSW
jgi:hypothetical protein